MVYKSHTKYNDINIHTQKKTFRSISAQCNFSVKPTTSVLGTVFSGARHKPLYSLLGVSSGVPADTFSKSLQQSLLPVPSTLL